MDTCLSAASAACPHSPWGNILSFGFCDTLDIFFLTLAVFSHYLCCFFLLSYTCMCWIFQASLLTIGGLIYLIGFKNIYVLFASMFLSPALTLLPILVLYVHLLTGHLQVICLLNTFTLTHSQWNTWFLPPNYFFPFLLDNSSIRPAVQSRQPALTIDSCFSLSGCLHTLPRERLPPASAFDAATSIYLEVHLSPVILVTPRQ